MKYILLFILLFINPVSAIYVNNLNVGLGNEAYIMVDDTNVTKLILKNATNQLEYTINGSTVDYTTLTNKTIASPSFNVLLDNFTAQVSGTAGDLNISVIMNNATDQYNLSANNIHISYNNSSDSALVWYNYTGAYPASLTVKWNMTYPIEFFIYKGYVTNILEAPIYQARIDINTSHNFTNAAGYYTFNMSKGNYTVLVRQIGYRNNSANITINQTNPWYNVTLNEKMMPAVKVSPAFDGIGLFGIMVVLVVIVRKSRHK